MKESDTEGDKSLMPIDYFRLKVADASSQVSAGNMARAIDSLASFTGGTELTFGSFDGRLLSEWVARQFFDGYYAKTVAYNVSKIAALYNKAVNDGLASPSEAFSVIVAKIKGASDRFDGIIHVDTFNRVQSLYRADRSASASRQLAKDVVLFGILAGGLTLEQIAAFRKDDYKDDDEVAAAIVARYSKPKNKYLFPLDQAHSTPRQLRQKMETLVGAGLKDCGIAIKGDSNLILVNLWSDMAMSCGISSSEIAACISVTGAANALTFCAEPADVSTARISEIRKRVGEAVTDNPARWYAMHLRPRVEFEELTARLKEKNIKLDEVFYPVEEIFRKVGKKKVFENRPVISWLVFYRTRMTQLNRLFHEIGDIAWGYRYRREVTSPYAVISDRDIREYQSAIGSLSPSTALLPDEDVQFNPGDYLVVLGGPMNGRPGTFIAEKKPKGEASGRIVFRISLTGGNHINWEVNWDPRLVRKITEEQYNELNGQLLERLGTMPLD